MMIYSRETHLRLFNDWAAALQDAVDADYNKESQARKTKAWGDLVDYVETHGKPLGVDGGAAL